MHPTGTVDLEFHPDSDDLGQHKKLRDGLSVALQIGRTLWVANDESTSLERLSLVAAKGRSGNYRYGREHRQFALGDYLRLPAGLADDPADVEEVDVEGLACDNGYLWLVGSHSLKRKNPGVDDDAKVAAKQLAQVRADGNRYLLARIPVVDEDGLCSLAKEAKDKRKKRHAAQLGGNAKGNDLMQALKEDKHLGPFLSIPGKDNGFDIEGLAVVGKRIFLGLRGPVLRGWAVVLEVELKEDKKQAATLRLQPIGPKQRPYRKHFLQLGGLGIRDMCVQGQDLLILGGPSMALDGPTTVFRWPGGTAPKGECVVPADGLERVLDIPHGQGVDHAEGMTLFSAEGEAALSLLVVYDSASDGRKLGESAVAADVFRLP
ncbi:Protein of unknown function [Rhodoferax sp. OV413]|uniref:DUF3616 domain-containing protein n=1 Tax=Rhodoferax sp. OV413 TaxID=1855285 RepID=UPI000882C5CD|nr:DUF3616 domain-containing protein [Rhodoferax sp. OV413]SDP13189.1 Protein of unknown function [Rhodoferax sp. OV413]